MAEGLSKHDAESEFFVSEAFLIKKALIHIRDMNLLIHVAVFRLETLDASTPRWTDGVLVQDMNLLIQNSALQ